MLWPCRCERRRIRGVSHLYKTMNRSALVLSLASLISCAGGQTTPLSPRDTLSIIITSVRELGDRGSISLEGRVWLVNDPGATGSTFLSPAAIEELSNLIPGLVPISEGDNVFECPDGGRPIFPGRSCPIRDDGTILSFGRIEVVDPETVHMWVGRTWPSYTFGAQFALRRSGPDDRWQFVGIVNGMIT